ncbi:hypothetical protein [Sphingobacterium bambusae]
MIKQIDRRLCRKTTVLLGAMQFEIGGRSKNGNEPTIRAGEKPS